MWVFKLSIVVVSIQTIQIIKTIRKIWRENQCNTLVLCVAAVWRLVKIVFSFISSLQQNFRSRIWNLHTPSIEHFVFGEFFLFFFFLSIYRIRVLTLIGFTIAARLTALKAFRIYPFCRFILFCGSFCSLKNFPDFVSLFLVNSRRFFFTLCLEFVFFTIEIKHRITQTSLRSKKIK